MTKERILEQALALFTDKGYEGASMDDIFVKIYGGEEQEAEDE